MADQHSADEAFSTDMQLIEELAAGLRMSRWPGDSDTIVELGDLEDTSILAVRNGVFTYETTSRGERSIQAAFRSLAAFSAPATAFSRCSGPTWMPSAEMNSGSLMPMKPNTQRR